MLRARVSVASLFESYPGRSFSRPGLKEGIIAMRLGSALHGRQLGPTLRSAYRTCRWCRRRSGLGAARSDGLVRIRWFWRCDTSGDAVALAGPGMLPTVKAAIAHKVDSGAPRDLPITEWLEARRRDSRVT